MSKQGAIVVLSALSAAFLLVSVSAGSASTHGQGHDGEGRGMQMMGQGMMAPGLEMPAMDPARGRKLFASKGCVVCHAVNGLGGEDAPPLDAATMGGSMNPFEFSAKMWRGAEAMIFLQREELGEQIEFTGGELADLTAFVHHAEEQKKFSEADISPRIRELMAHGHVKEEDHHAGEKKKDH